MLKKFLSILLVIFSIAVTEEPIKTKPQAIEMLKGTVIHVFEDFTPNNQKTTNRIAKARISQGENSEIVLIEVPPKPIRIDDRIYIAKMDSPETFGLGDSLEYKLTFIDFARDHYAIILLSVLILLAAFANKKSARQIKLFCANLLLILVILPVFLKLKIPLFIFVLLFLGLNTYFLYYVFESNKYQLAVLTALPVSIFTGILYKIFAHIARINEYETLQENLLLPTVTNFSEVNIISMIIASFFIYLFTSLFFIRHTFKENLYSNFSTTIWKITLVYLFIILGFHLPTLMFFSYNGLGFFNLFNYFNFSLSFFKLMFLYLGNILCCLSYLTVFYYKHKQHFQRHLQICESSTEHTKLDLRDMLSQHKETKYNEPVSAAKKKKLNTNYPEKKHVKKRLRKSPGTLSRKNRVN
jgi:hypothetical protein